MKHYFTINNFEKPDLSKELIITCEVEGKRCSYTIQKDVFEYDNYLGSVLILKDKLTGYPFIIKNPVYWAILADV